ADDRINTWQDRMQAAIREPVLDRVRGKAELQQLTATDHAVLLLRQPPRADLCGLDPFPAHSREKGAAMPIFAPLSARRGYAATCSRGREAAACSTTAGATSCAPKNSSRWRQVW